ncbi:GNAT family N-acetyltransferase [Gammaproteobacteria bacterium]|jgi:ribosomal protein S18 acetylase RimI-like enzyme|nr:GNAT family N-acetyltransferase [Gammaproteobacteria bacterium]
MNLHSTIIRSASPDDISDIAQFNIAMAQETEERQLDPETIQSGVSGVIQNHAHGFYLIAERDQVAVGSLLITFEWSDWRNGTLWWIQSVYVKPEHRRTGVFKALYDAVIARARAAKSVRGIRLYVEQENLDAQSVYQKLSMQKTPYQMFERML